MKNLAKFKVAVRTREYLVQAIFQLLFNNEDKDNILQQFEDEHATKKVDFENFNKVLTNIDKTKESLASILQDDLGLKNSEVELVDRAILYYGIYEIDNKELPKEVVIDECIRLSRKFSSPDSYKFINVYLDKFIKMKKDK
jgi:N utilization substance protein B|tara:strand:+ start:23535 stop:23957 length:423 start_codon:yes stop_codon:yes gene_type:complete